ncbi:MFS transporter [Siminovitchia acidinfaciens]|uniref:MFS transporter n=1 Tax=Siminovitchia acidinfaciens TaxID=2321395 RepID=A0A429Y8J2_9BACI|nr:MFS transporter [Siminovitchia acidinfaciens]RST77766.1 MFS transporter [Siminovitchia acidinfaciens]
MSIEKRNLWIMWICNFIIAASMTMVLPFLSLYIKTFGDFSAEYVQRWAGFIFGVTFLTAFFMSPIWGRIGDKYGFKPILIINGLGIALSIFLMGFMHHVHGLFLLRLVMGIVTGFIPTSVALIAKQTPKKEAGETLGTLQMGTVAGTLFGPLIGGLMADSFGFQYTFIITSLAIVLATIVVIIGIVEKPRDDQQKGRIRRSRKAVIQLILQRRMLVSVMAIAFIIQAGLFSIQPLLSLYVSELTRADSVALLSGLAFSATGFGNLLLTRKWGKLGDDIGYDRVMMILLILAAILIVPQALVTELWQLVILRFLFGMAIGGMLPCITAYIRMEAPYELQGEVLGYNQSFRFLGNVAGPLIGGIIAGYMGISSVFYVTGLLFLLAFGLLWWSMKQSHAKVKEIY